MTLGACYAPSLICALFRPAFLLAGSARVLVTHQRQYLPQCDRVLVLRAGRIYAIGTPAELAPLNLPELQVTEGNGHAHINHLALQYCGACQAQQRVDRPAVINGQPGKLSLVSPCADAELDDAAYDANMRSAVSGSLSEVADALPSRPESIDGDTSASTDDSSDAEGREVRLQLGLTAGTAGADLPRQAHGGHVSTTQRTRSWDDSVEESMAKIDADAAVDVTTNAKR